MLIHLNGWPGVGKLTVARALHARIGGRLLDNHSVYNIAFRLTDFRSDEFYETVRALRSVAYDRVAGIPPEIPVIMTNGLNHGWWGQENWDAIRALATRRGSPLYSVILTCDLDEHLRRMQSDERRYLGKLINPHHWQREGKVLLGDDVDNVLRLDTTDTPPEETALAVESWFKSAENARR